jgi:hypothetical protein
LDLQNRYAPSRLPIGFVAWKLVRQKEIL